MIIDINDTKKNILKNVEEKLKEHQLNPKLVILRASDDPGTLSYEKSIVNMLEPIGINVESIVVDENITQEALESKIKKLNEDDSVDSILVFKPLPEQIDDFKVNMCIQPEKDADALNHINLGKITAGLDNGLIPATVSGIITVLDENNIDVKGKDIVIVNNSKIIGRPLAMLLTERFATVTLCHEFTKDLEDYTKSADIVITAAGVANLIKPQMLKDDAVVIDAGIAMTEIDGKRVRVGDMDSKCNSKDRLVCSATPGCGGGMGPATTAELARNVLKCAMVRRNIW